MWKFIKKSFLVGLIIFLLVAVVAAAGGVALVFVYNKTDMQIDPGTTFDQLKAKLAVDAVVVADDGTTEMTSISTGGDRRRWVKITDVPPALIDAYIAAEDKNFHKHKGIDPEAIPGVVKTVIKTRRLRGGSTITMQTAKGAIGRQSNGIRGWNEKIREAKVALWLEENFSKDQILEMYINQIHIAATYKGVGVAAKYLFDKEIGQLSILECAFLAAIVKGPDNYIPFDKSTADKALALERTRDRVTYVLDNMLKLGKINVVQHTALIAELNSTGIAFKKGDVRVKVKPVFHMLREELKRPDIAAAVEQAGPGYRVVTTINAAVQTEAEVALAENNASLVDNPQGAVVVLDHGRIKALVGGIGDSNFFNRVADKKAVRQFGSTWKTPTYGSALSLNWRTEDLVVNLPQTFHYRGSSYSPDNSHKEAPVILSMLDAFAHSENVAAVWMLCHMLDKLTIDQIIELAKQNGMALDKQSLIKLVRDDLALRLSDKTLREGIFNTKRMELFSRLMSQDRIADAQALLLMSYAEFADGAGLNIAPAVVVDPLAGVGLDPVVTHVLQNAGLTAPEAALAEAPVVVSNSDVISELQQNVEAEFVRIQELMAASDLPKSRRQFELERLVWDQEFRIALSIRYIMSLAKTAGVKTPVNSDKVGLSLPLGAQDITLMDATLMYQAFMKGEVYGFGSTGSSTSLITQIQDASGKVVWQAPEPVVHQLLDTSIIPAMAQMMQAVVEGGTGSRFHNTLKKNDVVVPFGGKTGTTNDNLNLAWLGWFPALDQTGATVNHSSGWSIGAYVGHDQPQTIRAEITDKAGKVLRTVRADAARGVLPVAARIGQAIINRPEWGNPATTGSLPIVYGADAGVRVFSPYTPAPVFNTVTAETVSTPTPTAQPEPPAEVKP